MKINENSKVVLDYEVYCENELVDSSKDFLVDMGRNDLIRGLRENLLNLEENETKEFDVPPEKGYGNYSLELIKKLPKNMFPEDQQKLFVKNNRLQMFISGIPAIATVKEVDAETVTLDFNHPFAGKVLHFKVKINSVKNI